MTEPRARYPKRFVHAGRRTLGRQFRLLPDSRGEVRNAVGYLLTLAANKHNVTVTTFIHMCNHYHLAAGDEDALLPEFKRDFHSLMGRHFNHAHDVVQIPLWDNRKPYVCELLDRPSASSEILYMLLNPVRAGIVAHPKFYDGLVIGPEEWGKSLRFTRPGGLFTDESELPDFVILEPQPPPGFEDISLEALRRSFRHELKQKAKAIARNMTFHGLEGLTIFDTPETARAKHSGHPFATPELPHLRLPRLSERSNSSFERRKRFKAKDPRLVQLAIERESQFRSLYAERRESLSEGERDVVFPAGTYELRMRSLVETQEPPDTGWYPLASLLPAQPQAAFG